MNNRLVNSLILILLILGETACTVNPDAQSSSTSGIIFATAPANPTPTPTPFQPEPDAGNPIGMIPALETSAPPATQFLEPATTQYPQDPDNILPTISYPTPIYAPEYAPTPFPLMVDNETITFALLGSDTRSGTSFRTDTIVIAAVRPKSGMVTLISVPRDLWVYIPDYGMQRINTAYEYGQNYPGGGPGLLKDTILYNLGIRIDHTALVDFDGFRRIVNTLGGIDVPVACSYTDWRLINPNYDPENENNWALYTAGPGLIHMDGDLALWYARSRKKSSDFDRGRRSQEVLRALFTRGMQMNALLKVPELYNDLNSTVTTDLTLADLLSLSPLALHMNNADIRSYYIGKEYVTNWTTSLGAAVLLPNGPAIQAMLQKALSPSTQLAEAAHIQVEIRNGTQIPSWEALAAERLNYAGFGTSIALADRTDYANTLLYDLTSDQDPMRAANLLAIMGLQPSALVAAPMESDVSYVLILGADYQACFNPSNLAP